MDQVEAIVLSATPYSETTLIVRLLTRDHGVVRALAKGARRPKSRFQGVFEGFNVVQALLRLREPEKLGTLGDSSVSVAWSWLREDLPRFAYAGLGMEVLGRLAEASPADEFFYDEGNRFLKQLGPVTGPGSLTIALLMRLLHHGGFHPRLAEPWTRETLPMVLAYDFQDAAFVTAVGISVRHQMQMPREAVVAVLPALDEIPLLDETFRVPPAAGPALLRWLIRVWEDHLGAKLKSAEFLEKMVLCSPAQK